jgi:hypothetical protein
MLQQVPNVVVKAMPPSPHPFVDAFVSLLPALIAVGGGLWALYKYLRDKKDALDKDRAVREQANKTAEVESQKPFSAKQQEVYFDLLATTSFIATREPENDEEKKGIPKREAAIRHFWVLFWGTLPVVANQDVAIAADAFSVALDHEDDFVPLRNASMDLARACRRALGTAWNIGLEHYDKGDAAIAKSIPERSEFYPQSGPTSA